MDHGPEPFKSSASSREGPIGRRFELMRVVSSATAMYPRRETRKVSCQLRLNFFTAAAAGSSNPLARLEVGDSRYSGFVQVTAYTSPTRGFRHGRRGLWTTTATEFWAEGAFSRYQGHPRVVALHDSRLIFAGTKFKPLRLHGSPRLTISRTTARAASPMRRSTLRYRRTSPIRSTGWSARAISLIGTAGEEWTLERTDDAEALSATNVNADRQSSYGSAYLQARLVNEVVMFVQRQGRKVRELTFAFERDGWVAPDLTILANHITGKGHRGDRLPAATRCGLLDHHFRRETSRNDV